MITELTEYQKSQIPVYLERQLLIASCTDEADWETGERVVPRMLEIAKVEMAEDFKVLRVPNPMLAAQSGHKKALAIDGVGGNTLMQSATYGGMTARNDFFVEVCGVQLPPELEECRLLLRDFVRAVGGVYLHSSFAILYDRPSVLKIRQENGRGILHCEDGPAIAWGRGPDGKYDRNAKFGLSLYYWQGTRIPEKWIMEKPTNEAEMRKRAGEVLSCENQETLRAGCEILGWVPVLESLGMKVIDEDENPIFGKLVSVNLPQASDSRFLVAQCGTGRTIAVPVSTEARTAVEAGALSYGVPETLYRTLKVRT